MLGNKAGGREMPGPRFSVNYGSRPIRSWTSSFHSCTSRGTVTSSCLLTVRRPSSILLERDFFYSFNVWLMRLLSTCELLVSVYKWHRQACMHATLPLEVVKYMAVIVNSYSSAARVPCAPQSRCSKLSHFFSPLASLVLWLVPNHVNGDA